MLLRVSVTYGHPFMIDVGDCDARLPSSGDERDVYIDQLVRLSVLVGKVMKNIYTCVCYLMITILFDLLMFASDYCISSNRPAGLNVTDDNKLQGILDELESWKVKLPPELQFRGPETPISGGTCFSIAQLDL